MCCVVLGCVVVFCRLGLRRVVVSRRLGLGWIFGRFGDVLGRFLVVLGASWGILEGSWGHLGRSWGRLGPSWVVRVVLNSTGRARHPAWCKFWEPKRGPR